MERMGLVWQVERQLERMISLEQLPADGSLPSEQSLSRSYGVSRATVREALLRLSARGLVVQHPGRRTRAVVLEEAMTLENLSVALEGVGRADPDRWKLLEGFFALKRETTVELLAACCERASAVELERLEGACFALMEAARWNEGGGWLQQEFALLRLAARAAQRPGHLLLIHSLERSYGAMAERVLPHLDAKTVYSWAKCALHALGEKNAQALRRELPPLLQVCDERLFGSLAPASPAVDTCEAHTKAAGAEVAEATAPNPSSCLTGLGNVSPIGEGLQPEPASGSCRPEPDDMALREGSPLGHEEKGGAKMHPPSLPSLEAHALHCTHQGVEPSLCRDTACTDPGAAEQAHSSQRCRCGGWKD